MTFDPAWLFGPVIDRLWVLVCLGDGSGSFSCDMISANTDVTWEVALSQPQPPVYVGIPAMSLWGMIIFMIVVGFGAAYYLRKRYTDS